MNEARRGMVLAMNVSHPERPDQDILKRGFVLDDAVLAKMRELGIDVLFIDYPGLEDLDRHLAVQLSPARQRIYQQIKSTIGAIQKTSRPTVGFADYYAGIRELIVTLLQSGKHPIYLELMSKRLGSQAIEHATAVAQLSLALGIRLERYLIEQRNRLSADHAREVVNLGVAGMLHDIGKAKLPDALRHHNCVNPPQDPKQLAEWESHVSLGYELIRGGVEASAAATVLQHHQHYDGTGFPMIASKEGPPAPMSNSRIHVFARIVTAADLFNRLTFAPEMDRRHTVEVLHLMRTQYAGWLDPDILRVFPSVAPPFPPATKVRLSDNTAAVVVGLDLNDPYRPKVRRFAPDGAALMDETIDLRKDPGLNITSIGEVDVRAWGPQSISTAA